MERRATQRQVTVNQISLNPLSVARVLGGLAFLLVLISTAGQLTAHLTEHSDIYGLVQFFNVDAERNIPTGFSTLLLLFAALLLAAITVLERKQEHSPVLHWAVLSCGFLVMAADEALSFHDRLTPPMRRLLGDHDLGVLYYAWVVPGILIVCVLGLFFRGFLLRLPATTRLAFLVAATLYIGGAIGFEAIGGRFAELYGTEHLTYSMIVTVEESLEMCGVIVFIWALLAYLANTYGEVRVRLDGNQERHRMIVDQISLNSLSVALVLGAVAVLLVLTSIGGQLIAYLTGHTNVYGLVRLFYVDAESNIPTGYSTILLLFAGLLLTIITVLERKRAYSSARYWATLGVGFFLMAADEALSFHERLISPMRRVLGDEDLGIFYFAWVVPGIVLVLILSLLFARFLMRLAPNTRRAFLVAGCLYIGGVIGVELIGGHFAELHGRRNLTYSMIATLEESLEMCGIIVFIRALLVYIANTYTEVRLRLDH